MIFEMRNQITGVQNFNGHKALARTDIDGHLVVQLNNLTLHALFH